MAHQSADRVRDDEPHESDEARKAHRTTRERSGGHQRGKAREADVEAQGVRLVLAQNVAKTIKNGMALLGIEVPERM